jgi:uncharacterized ParB-like nuclease family protein
VTEGREIELDQIRLDGNTQARAAERNREVVDDYAEHIDELPPADVFFDGEHYWLADGFHRYDAHRTAKRLTMRCRVHLGNQRDARLFAIGANDRHGVRRTNSDKRNAVRLLLADAEWRANSDHWIAGKAGVTQPFVSKIRKALQPQAREYPAIDNSYRSVSAPTGTEESDACSDGVTHPGPGEANAGDTGDAGDDATAVDKQTYSAAATAKKDGDGEIATVGEAALEVHHGGEGEAPPLADELGTPLPDREDVRQAFKDLAQFKKASSLLAELTAVLGQLWNSPAARKVAGVWPQLEGHRKQTALLLRSHQPHAICPECRGRAGRCGRCGGDGWLSLEAWKRQNTASEVRSAGKGVA